jgi:hypothetical protein
MTIIGMCVDCVEEFRNKCFIIFDIYPQLEDKSIIWFDIDEFIEIMDSIKFNFNTLTFNILQKDLRE